MDSMESGKYFKVSKFRIHAKSLEKNPLKDQSEREVTVIERNVRDGTPALIGLAGFFGSSRSFLNRYYSGRDFITVLENISRKKADSFLIVLPDTITSFFGNQYLNSTAVGNYEDFIVKDVVDFISREYGKRNIGLFGKSSGGFGAYNLASSHPDVFRGFLDVSGDSGFEYCYIKDFPSAIMKLEEMNPRKFLKYFREKPHPDSSDMGIMNTIAMSAFYSPNPESELGFDLPFDPRRNLLDEATWARWLELDPLRNIENRLEGLRDQVVILQVGKRDEFSINIGMKGMSNILTANKIRHRYREYDEGHFGIEYFYEYSIPLLTEGLKD